MKPEHIKSNRFAPYITPRRALHQKPITSVIFADVEVQEAPNTGLARLKQVSYGLFKAAPLAAAAFPHPITYGVAIASAAESLYRARDGDKADMLAAFAILGSGIQGAAADTVFAYTGNGTAVAISTVGECSSITQKIDCKGSSDIPYGFRSNILDAGEYVYCIIPRRETHKTVLDPDVPVLPIALNAMLDRCISAHDQCVPYNGATPPPVCNTTMPTPSSTLTRSTAGPTSTGFITLSQTTTGAVVKSTPPIEVLTTCPPNQPNNDALYASTAAAFGFGVGVGALATCGAAFLRSKKADEEQTDQPARMTSYVRPRLISESSNRSDASARSDTSDLVLSPIYEAIPAVPEYYRMAPVAINLPEPVYAQPNYPPIARVESDYVDMAIVNQYENQTNL